MKNVTLCLIEPEKYFSHIIKILKSQTEIKNMIYVTTNKPYSNLITIFKEHKIKYNKIFFIDCISGHVGIKAESENCIFLDSPQNLTAISIAINESLKNIPEPKVLLLDSLSTLLLYNSAETIGKFSNFLINKIRTYKIQMLLIALESDTNKDVIQKIESFTDEVKRYGS